MPDMKLIAYSVIMVLSGLFVLIGAKALWWASNEQDILTNGIYFGTTCNFKVGIYKGVKRVCTFYGTTTSDDHVRWHFLGGDIDEDDTPDGTVGVAYFSVITFILDVILAVMVCLPNRMTKVELGLGVVCLVCVATTFVSSIIFSNEADEAEYEDTCIGGCTLTFVGCVFNLIGVLPGLVFTGMFDVMLGVNCGPAEANTALANTDTAKGTMEMELVATVDSPPPLPAPRVFPPDMVAWVQAVGLTPEPQHQLLVLLTGDVYGAVVPRDLAELESVDLDKIKMTLPKTKQGPFQRAVDQLKAAAGHQGGAEQKMGSDK